MRCNEIQTIKDADGNYLMGCFKMGTFISIDTEVKDLCKNCEVNLKGELFDETRT